MPKVPILSREAFYDRLRDGTYIDLDWNLVNTSLGAMVEPRRLSEVVTAASPIVQADAADVSFDRRTEIDGDRFFSLMGTGGNQSLVDFNTQ